MYWIGGPIEDRILSKATSELIVVDDGDNTKKILTFPQEAVVELAKDSRIRINKSTGTDKKKPKSNPKRRKKAKGEWRKKVDSGEHSTFTGRWDSRDTNKI